MPRKKKLKTQKEKLVAALEALGYKLDTNARSSKYSTFRKGNSVVAYLVGKAGALRKTKGSVANSISLSDRPIHAALLTVGERANDGLYASEVDALDDLKKLVA
jgi:hypothetical protein